MVAKQWMWKLEHGRRREIDELHVPLGQPVKLIMTSQDVIHSFYVPAFRVKAGRAARPLHELWFTATQVGRFHLFCAEYCGTDHARMGGDVVVMAPAEFQRWLAAHARGRSWPRAARAVPRVGCSGCHEPTADRARALARGPVRPARAPRRRQRPSVADERYLRDSMLLPESRSSPATTRSCRPSRAARGGRAHRPHRLHQVSPVPRSGRDDDAHRPRRQRRDARPRPTRAHPPAISRRLYAALVAHDARPQAHRASSTRSRSRRSSSSAAPPRRSSASSC